MQHKSEMTQNQCHPKMKYNVTGLHNKHNIIVYVHIFNKIINYISVQLNATVQMYKQSQLTLYFQTSLAYLSLSLSLSLSLWLVVRQVFDWT